VPPDWRAAGPADKSRLQQLARLNQQQQQQQQREQGKQAGRLVSNN
jgi:hypothetical protein